MYQTPLQKHLLRVGARACCALLLLASAATGLAQDMPYQENLPPFVDSLQSPTTVAVGPDERIYVAEPSYNRVQVYGSAGQHQTTLSMELQEPVAVAVGSDGQLYVGDAGSGQVSVYGPDMVLRGRLGKGAGEFLRPAAIAVSPGGDIYVADGDANLVKVYGSDRALKFSFGGKGTTAGLFVDPVAVAANPGTGEILVVDQTQTGPTAGKPARVQIFDGTGKWLRGFDAKTQPLGVVVDQANRIYISDAYQNDIYIYDAQGVSLGRLAVNPARPLRTPLGMAYSPGTGRLFVASIVSASVEVYGIDTHYARIALNVPLLDFGEVNAGALSALKQLDLSNNGTADLKIGVAALSGVDAAAFFVREDTCSNRTLAPGAGCYFKLLFAPLSGGARNAKLTIASGDISAPQTEVALRGTGLPQQQLTPGSDGDGDGMADAWELAYGLNPWNPVDAAEDPDGDGFTNLEEYLAGSDPRSAASNPGRLAFATPAIEAGEGAGSAALAVSRTGGSAGAVSVQCRTLDGSAVAGSDYTYTSVRLEWANGDATDKTCAVPISDDAVAEDKERFQAVLESPVGAKLGVPTTAEITVADNDGLASNPGRLAFVSSSLEVGEGAGSAVLAVRRSGGNAGAVSVQCRTFDGSAVTGSDYTYTSVRLEWAGGDMADKTCAVPIIDDAVAEGVERFQAMLLNPAGGVLGSPATAEITITDNDGPPPGPGRLAFAAATLEVSEGAGNAALVVRRSGGNAGTVSVLCRTIDGSAVAGSDYTYTSVRLEWANGDATDKTCAVPIIDDAVAEGKERFQAVLENQAGGAVFGSPVAADITVLDDDSTAVRNDFNGDGNSDVLVRNRMAGTWYYYPLDGKAVVQGAGAVALPDGNWDVAGAGDFDGDGRADVLARNRFTGEWCLYLMNGAQILSQQPVPGLPNDMDWKVAGTGDFDGDGKADVLLRSAGTRAWYLYPLDGARIGAGAGSMDMTRDAAWQMVGAGDFNGDGADDVLLRSRKTGRWYYYALQGTRILADSGYLPLQGDTRWQMAGIGDFNGDGMDDVLLRNTSTGKWYYHPVDGKNKTVLKEGGLATLSADLQWAVAGIGDYNGDDHTDVLLRNAATGKWYYYPLDGKKVLPGGGYVDLPNDASWQPAER